VANRSDYTANIPMSYIDCVIHVNRKVTKIAKPNTKIGKITFIGYLSCQPVNHLGAACCLQWLSLSVQHFYNIIIIILVCLTELNKNFIIKRKYYHNLITNIEDVALACVAVTVLHAHATDKTRLRSQSRIRSIFVLELIYLL
jgi:hypothetical protein